MGASELRIEAEDPNALPVPASPFSPQALQKGSWRVWTLLESLGFSSLSLLSGIRGKNGKCFSWEVCVSASGAVEKS